MRLAYAVLPVLFASTVLESQTVQNRIVGRTRSGRPARHRVGPTTEPYVRISRIRLFGNNRITAVRTPQAGGSEAGCAAVPEDASPREPSDPPKSAVPFGSASRVNVSTPAG